MSQHTLMPSSDTTAVAEAVTAAAEAEAATSSAALHVEVSRA